MENFTQVQAQTRRFLNVLLVEDDDIDARIIGLVADLVEGFDLGLTRVNTLTAAKSALQYRKFDICLLDFWLGRESSLRFLSALDDMDNCVGTVVLSNITPEDADRLRLASPKNVFLPKADCNPLRLKSAIEAVVPFDH